MLINPFRKCNALTLVRTFSSYRKRSVFGSEPQNAVDDDEIPAIFEEKGKKFKKTSSRGGNDDDFDALIRNAATISEGVPPSSTFPSQQKSRSPFMDDDDFSPTSKSTTGFGGKGAVRPKPVSDTLDEFFSRAAPLTTHKSPSTASLSSTFPASNDDQYDFSFSKDFSPKDRDSRPEPRRGNFDTPRSFASDRNSSFQADRNNREGYRVNERPRGNYGNSYTSSDSSFAASNSREHGYKRDRFDYSSDRGARRADGDHHGSRGDAWNDAPRRRERAPLRTGITPGLSATTPDGEFVRGPGFIHNLRPTDENILGRDKASPWSELRGRDDELLSPHLPVPVVGEPIYGVHAVLSALAHDRRDSYSRLYVVSNMFEDIKREMQYEQREKTNKMNPLTADQSPDNSLSGDDVSAIQALLAAPAPVSFVEDSDGGWDDVPMVDGNSREVPLVRGPTERERVSREALRLIMALAQARKDVLVFPMSRLKLDMLSGQRPHNGVVLDAAPLRPPTRVMLSHEDVGVEAKEDVVATLRAQATTHASPDADAAMEDNGAVDGEVPMEDANQAARRRKDKRAQGPAVWLALDRVQDPQNIGAIVRSAAFFGARGIIIPKVAASPLSPVAAKAASGALDAIDIIQVSNLGQFLRRSRDLHDEYYVGDVLLDAEKAAVSRSAQPSRTWGSLCVMGLSANVDSVSCYELSETLNYPQALETEQPFGIVLVLGSEGAGIAADVATACHMHVTIPGFGVPSTNLGRIVKRLGKNSPLRGTSFKPLLDSLNVSSAAAIALHQLANAIYAPKK